MHRRSERRKESRLNSRREEYAKGTGAGRREKTREGEREREREREREDECKASKPRNTFKELWAHTRALSPLGKRADIGRVGCPLRCTGGANGGRNETTERREGPGGVKRAQQSRGEQIDE